LMRRFTEIDETHPQRQEKSQLCNACNGWRAQR